MEYYESTNVSSLVLSSSITILYVYIFFQKHISMISVVQEDDENLHDENAKRQTKHASLSLKGTRRKEKDEKFRRLKAVPRSTA